VALYFECQINQNALIQTVFLAILLTGYTLKYTVLNFSNFLEKYQKEYRTNFKIFIYQNDVVFLKKDFNDLAFYIKV